MTWLLTADLHLTDRPRDSYRFGIFKWMAKQQQAHNVTATFILGDITDSKDKHSSALVNRMVDELIGLKPPIYILKGNHDCISLSDPFFRFLSCIEGIHFIVEPTLVLDGKVAMIPYQPDQVSFDRACGIITPKLRGVMLHGCFTGAIAETGARLTGLGASLVEAKRPLGVWAGDIHRPQQCGPVTYVGAPYHVRFNDDFTPRVLLIKKGVEQNLYYPAPHKWSLTVHDADDITRNEDLRPKDQVQVTVELAREEAVEWSAHRERVIAACRAMGLDVCGVSLTIRQRRERVKVGQSPQVKGPVDVLNAFCTAEGVASNIKKVGLDLLKV